MLTSEPVVIAGTAALVLAHGTVPDDALLVELEAAAAGGGFAVGVGDVLTPRTIEEAVPDGVRAAVAI